MSLPYFRLYPTDYEADTSHLTLIEDGAYNRLLRLCWTTPGCSLPDDLDWIMRRMRVRDDADRQAVETVLSEYFIRGDQRVSNKRLMQEYEYALNRHDAASENSMKRWAKNKPLKTKEKAPSGRNATAMRAQCNGNANQNQNQNHNTPLPPKGFDEFWQAYPRKIGKAAAEKAYAKAVKQSGHDEIMQGLNSQLPSISAKEVQFQPHPSTWLNQGRWEDQMEKPTKVKEPWEYWL